MSQIQEVKDEALKAAEAEETNEVTAVELDDVNGGLADGVKWEVSAGIKISGG